MQASPEKLVTRFGSLPLPVKVLVCSAAVAGALVVNHSFRNAEPTRGQPEPNLWKWAVFYSVGMNVLALLVTPAAVGLVGWFARRAS